MSEGVQSSHNCSPNSQPCSPCHSTSGLKHPVSIGLFQVHSRRYWAAWQYPIDRMTLPSNAIPPPPWVRSAGRKLSELVQVRQGPGPQNSCQWQLATLPLRPTRDVEAAAWLVADELMRARFGKASHLYRLWHRGATTNRQPSSRTRKRIEPFVSTAFGLPTSPKTQDHVEGLVAEHVWFHLATEMPGPGRTIRHSEHPSFHPTAPGGDGLVIYEIPGGTLIFRLWEVKKHASSRQISTTIKRAYNQLADNATAYLAQYVALPPANDQEVSTLFASLVDMWVDAEPQAGAGIAIGTSHARTPKKRCFTNMQNFFPDLDHGDQLEGLVAGIANFPAFACLVRDFIWNAL